MTTARDRMISLAERLSKATNEGKADWTSENHASFLLALPSASARIRSVDGDGLEPYELTIIDDNGVSIESLRSEWEGEPFRSESEYWNETLSDLYETARTKALNIGSVIDNLLADLEKGTPGDPSKVPPPPPPERSSADDDIPF
jgi:hypothetical protein